MYGAMAYSYGKYSHMEEFPTHKWWDQSTHLILVCIFTVSQDIWTPNIWTRWSNYPIYDKWTMGVFHPRIVEPVGPNHFLHYSWSLWNNSMSDPNQSSIRVLAMCLLTLKNIWLGMPWEAVHTRLKKSRQFTIDYLEYLSVHVVSTNVLTWIHWTAWKTWKET